MISRQDFLRKEIREKSSDKGYMGQRHPRLARKTMKINFLGTGTTIKIIITRDYFLSDTINILSFSLSF